MKWRNVLIRIKNAHAYLKENEKNPKAIEAAEKRFEQQVLPEALKAGIDEQFAWALFYFGHEFIKAEFRGREKL